VASTAALVAATLAVAYAVVNAFGAWAVVRRRSSIGATFFVAAVALTIGAVAISFGRPSATIFVAVGAGAASLASWWNARVFLGRVEIRRHVARAAFGVAATVLADLATRG
jgi:hypothetical protein